MRLTCHNGGRVKRKESQSWEKGSGAGRWGEEEALESCPGERGRDVGKQQGGSRRGREETGPASLQGCSVLVRKVGIPHGVNVWVTESGVVRARERWRTERRARRECGRD